MRPWIVLVAAATSAAAVVPLLQRHASADQADAGAAPRGMASPSAAAKPPPLPPLTGIELDKLALRDDEATAAGPLGRVAHLSIDPALQRAAMRTLQHFAFPEAAVVVTNTATGRVLVWANHVEKGPRRDLCSEANAPAASIFKIVTGAALVETGGLTPEARQCYSGGESKLTAVDLVDDPRRDRWCATLSEAMGRSINAVFARLALKKLNPPDLVAMATAFGFGETLPFDVPVAVSAAHIPEDKLGFARTAAGVRPVRSAYLAISASISSRDTATASRRATSSRTSAPRTASAAASRCFSRKSSQLMFVFIGSIC